MDIFSRARIQNHSKILTKHEHPTLISTPKIPVPSLKLTARPWKAGVGTPLFTFGVRQIFAFAVSFRVSWVRPGLVLFGWPRTLSHAHLKEPHPLESVNRDFFYQATSLPSTSLSAAVLGSLASNRWCPPPAVGGKIAKLSKSLTRNIMFILIYNIWLLFKCFYICHMQFLWSKCMRYQYCA